VVADITKQIADLDVARTIEAPPAGNLRTSSAINAQTAAVAATAKLRAADDQRRQAKRTSLADKLTTEAKTLAELRVDKAKIDEDLRCGSGAGPVPVDAIRRRQRDDIEVVRLNRGGASGPERGPAPTGRNTTVILALCR
jgi:hypothetical protein